MSKWRNVKIGDVAKQKKGSTTIRDDVDYKLCRVQLHRKGVVLRETVKGSKIKTKKQQVCHKGDLVVAEMDAKFGGYGFIDTNLDGAIVSSHYYLYEFDTKQILRDYFTVVIHSGLIQNQIEAKGSTNYSSIRAWEFLNYTIPLPELKTQESIAKRFLKVYNGKNELNDLNSKQLELIALIRQSILEEAVEGKLTAEWRREHHELISGDNHALELLRKIRAEKEQLIKEGKIRKEQPLTPISDDEKPFDIPEGWAWCRLGEIIIYAGNLDIHSKLKPDTLINYVDIDSIDNKDHKIGQIKTKKVSELSSRARRVLKKGYMVYSTVRPYLENIAFVEEDIDNLIGSTGFNVFKTVCISQEFIFYLLLSPYINELYKEMMIGFNSPSITNEQFENTMIPIPPIEEEQAIVDRIRALIATLEGLRKQISERKDLSEMLMQSVLREAFATN